MRRMGSMSRGRGCNSRCLDCPLSDLLRYLLPREPRCVIHMGYVRWSLENHRHRAGALRCNICSLFMKKEVIKGKEHKCPKEAMDAVADEKLTQQQLARAVDKMLREAKEEEDEYEPAAEGEVSSSKGVLKKK